MAPALPPRALSFPSVRPSGSVAAGAEIGIEIRNQSVGMPQMLSPDVVNRSGEGIGADGLHGIPGGPSESRTVNRLVGHPGASPFQVLDQLGNVHHWRRPQNQVNMVHDHSKGQDSHVVPLGFGRQEA
jgi:hypothetical protein